MVVFVIRLERLARLFRNGSLQVLAVVEVQDDFLALDPSQ